jgi:flagellar export protein FliJ
VRETTETNRARTRPVPSGVKAGGGDADGLLVSGQFKFRLEQVLDHRARREDMVRQELAQAMAAVAAQQERAVAAQALLDGGLAHLRSLMETPTELAALRAAHADLAILRARAAHEAATVDRLGEVADERRAELVRASQDKEAIGQLKERARERHRAEELRQDAIEMDELALRRAARAQRGAAA